MAVIAFCPSYVTGIFNIQKNDAAGAGFAINKGMTTSISSTRGKTKISINGKKSAAPVSNAVLSAYRELYTIPSISITHKTPLPIGFGMGMSAAGAVSFSLALNEFLGAGLTFEKCVKIAHDSEVKCGTGLSGADAAAIGGILARRSVKSKPVQFKFEEREFHFAFFSPIKTSSIIFSKNWKSKVNAASGKALPSLFKKRDLGELLSQSRSFAINSGLAAWCKGELASNPRASMAMVGKTLFSDVPLRLPAQPLKRMEAKTYEFGAHLV